MTVAAGYPFVRVPVAALDALSLPDGDSHRIGPAELAVVAVLARYANSEGEAWPAVGTIARKTGFSSRHVQGLLRRLEVTGLVRREAVAGRCSRYRVGGTWPNGVNRTAHVSPGSDVNSQTGREIGAPEAELATPRTAVRERASHASLDLEASIQTLSTQEQQAGQFFEIDKSDEQQLRTFATSRGVDFDALRQKAAQHYRGQSLRKSAVAVLRDWLERERPSRVSRLNFATNDERQSALRQVGESWDPEVARA